MIFKMTDRTYDIFKFITLKLLPGLGTLYFTLSKVWGGLPYCEEVVGTLSAVALFIGFLLDISKKNYEGDGTLNVDTSNPDKDVYNLAVAIPFEEMKKKKAITLKVNNVLKEDFTKVNP